MQHLLIIVSACCFFVAFMVFLQSMNNAFKKNFLWGVVYILFPIGSYFYYKKFITEEQSNIIKLAVWLLLGTLTFVVAKLL
jgi:predicted neutral ceramidase superfamily lipid hydrolase